MSMPYLVQGCIDGRTLAVTAATAKAAFATAIEWHIAKKFAGVSISDGNKIYSIDEFAAAIALQEIAETMESTSTKRECQ